MDDNDQQATPAADARLRIAVPVLRHLSPPTSFHARHQEGQDRPAVSMPVWRTHLGWLRPPRSTSGSGPFSDLPLCLLLRWLQSQNLAGRDASPRSLSGSAPSLPRPLERLGVWPANQFEGAEASRIVPAIHPIAANLTIGVVCVKGYCGDSLSIDGPAPAFVVPDKLSPASAHGSLSQSGLCSMHSSNSDRRDDGLIRFAGRTIVDAKTKTRLLRFEAGQHQWPTAFGARRPKMVDKLEIKRGCHRMDQTAPLRQE